MCYYKYCKHTAECLDGCSHNDQFLMMDDETLYRNLEMDKHMVFVQDVLVHVPEGLKHVQISLCIQQKCMQVVFHQYECANDISSLICFENTCHIQGTCFQCQNLQVQLLLIQSEVKR